ncbi:hypothetical protein ACWEWX_47700 [Streptomyces asiaticus]
MADNVIATLRGEPLRSYRHRDLGLVTRSPSRWAPTAAPSWLVAHAAEPHIDTAAAEPHIDTAPRPFGALPEP